MSRGRNTNRLPESGTQIQFSVLVSRRSYIEVEQKQLRRVIIHWSSANAVATTSYPTLSRPGSRKPSELPP
jgi:Flp pilus assembly protein TadG